MIKSAAAIATIAAVVTLVGCSSSGAPSASKPTVIATTTSTATETVTVTTTVTAKAPAGKTDQARPSSTSTKVTSAPPVSNPPAPKVAASKRPVAPTSKAKAGPSLTNQQQNAVSSAQSYLSFSGFSRQGLIDQLSSAYGDQYSVHDATVAVDSLHEDWNAQAVRSAKQYLKLQGFSCKGLIAQLDSAYGDKYTLAQATYGARHAGAC